MTTNLFGPTAAQIQQANFQNSLKQRQALAAQAARGRPDRPSHATGISMLGSAIGDFIGGKFAGESPAMQKAREQEALTEEFGDIDVSDTNELYRLADAYSQQGQLKEALQITAIADKRKKDQMDYLEGMANQGDLGVMGKSVNYAAKVILKCDINDPECANKAFNLALDFKREQPDETAEKAKFKGWAKANVDDRARYVEQRSKAGAEIRQIDNMVGYLDQAYQGIFGDNLIFKVNQTLGQLGLGEGTEAAEFLQSGFSQMSINWAEKLSGVASDADMKRIDRSIGSLSNTREGNALILSMLRAEADYKRRAANEWTSWYRNAISTSATGVPNPADFDAYLETWKKENGYKAPTQAQIDAAVQGTPMPKMGKGKPEVKPEVTEEEEPKTTGDVWSTDSDGNLLFNGKPYGG